MKTLMLLIAMKLSQMTDEGIITRADDHEGRPTYHLNLPDGTTYEYAYAEEILEYLITGTFEYDETLTLLNSKPITEPITFATNN